MVYLSVLVAPLVIIFGKGIMISFVPLQRNFSVQRRVLLWPLWFCDGWKFTWCAMQSGRCKRTSIRSLKCIRIWLVATKKIVLKNDMWRGRSWRIFNHFYWNGGITARGTTRKASICNQTRKRMKVCAGIRQSYTVSHATEYKIQV